MLHEWSYETQTRFLKEVEKMELPPLPRSIVPEQSDLLRLYTAFLHTPHFAAWWEREAAASGCCALSRIAFKSIVCPLHNSLHIADEPRWSRRFKKTYPPHDRPSTLRARY